jgi:lysyl oxidase/dipeptidyl peptidase IV (DPP IV)-like protein/WD40 repeat protein
LIYVGGTPSEPLDARVLAVDRGAIVRIAPTGSRTTLIREAQDAAYSPDGTFVAFARDGDLWLANSDGSGQRRLTQTPNVAESRPSWLPDGTAIVYTAGVSGLRQIRVVTLPTGPSQRLAASTAAEYSGVVSRQGRLAFVSTRSGTPQIYVAQPNGDGATPFSAEAYTDVHDLAWSPDGTELAYDAHQDDGTTKLVVDDGTTQTVGPVGTRPVWSPTGARIAFDAGAGTMQSIAADLVTDLRQLGAGSPLDWRVVPVGTPLFPNLVMRPPSGLVLMPLGGGRWWLGFGSMVDSRGPGILWIRANRRRSERFMSVRQYVQLQGGGARVDAPSGELHYVVARPHFHWHLLGYVHTELRTAGDFKLRVRDHKSGFCIADHYAGAIGVPHGPPRFLGNCKQFHPNALYVEEGSSVGYTDRYPAFFHGQQLDITGLKAGDYWLVQRANPDLHLRETRYDDNAAALLIRLTWHGGTPHISKLRTCRKERC